MRLPEFADPGPRVATMAGLAQELLPAGETEEAIRIFEELEETLTEAAQRRGMGADWVPIELPKLLALFWLRLGEPE